MSDMTDAESIAVAFDLLADKNAIVHNVLMAAMRAGMDETTALKWCACELAKQNAEYQRATERYLATRAVPIRVCCAGEHEPKG